MKKKRLTGRRILLGALAVLLVLVLGLLVAFKVYTSDYYTMLPGTEDNLYLTVEMHTEGDLTIIGDPNAEKGLIFYPGAKVEARAYAPLLDRIAREGFCCVLVEMPYHLAILNVDAAEEAMAAVPEVKQWYLAGHSLGGATAAMYAADNPDKIAGLALLGAYSTKQLPETLPVLLMYGSEDGVLNREKYSSCLANVPNADEQVIEGGNHAGFGNYGPQKGDGEASITPEQQWDITAKAITDWMQ